MVCPPGLENFDRGAMSELEEQSRAEKVGTAVISKVLNVGVDGLGPLDGARKIADDHLAQHGDVELAIDRLIRTHQRIVGASGFATGVGGLVTLPVTIPTDVAVLYIQQGRLAASIAHLRGYDISSEEVRAVVLLTLLGSAGAGVASKFGIELGNKMALGALKKVPGQVFIKVNKAVGFRLVTKAGSKGLINMTKIVPIAGGFAGAGINVTSTAAVGKYAKTNFPARAGTAH
ncbi:EcsC family protein [Janibacter sp. Y6]|uniref:EcsC family protein n=1 Tax=Janibacter sp. Y6 TaxID=2913552 RepID=UPI0034A3609D